MTEKKVLIIAFLFVCFACLYGAIFNKQYYDEYYKENGGYQLVQAICTKKPSKRSKQNSMSISFYFIVNGEKTVVNGFTVPYGEPYTSIEKDEIILVTYAVQNPQHCIKVEAINR